MTSHTENPVVLQPSGNLEEVVREEDGLRMAENAAAHNKNLQVLGSYP